MIKDVPDGERVGDEGEDSHFAAAVGASQPNPSGPLHLAAHGTTGGWSDRHRPQEKADATFRLGRGIVAGI